PSRQVELPFGQDGSIVNIDADYASLEVVGGDSIDAVLGINYEVFGLEDVEALARLISCAETDAAPPAMFWSAAGYESAEISDLDSLIRGADPAILVEQWSDDANPGRLTARLGANENGPVRVDLRDLGPHALISGDLEGFLPAWICSLATSYSPADLNFYLIDSTGGSVFRCCQDLPHTIGSLYDSSLLQVKPALAMLSAELDRREAVLSSLALDTVENLVGEGRSSPFPYLVVAVDRVEQLRAASFRISGEVVSLDPVAEMLTLSERGQQLGVHLLLGSDGDQPLTDRIPLRLHASRTGSSTLTVGQAPSVSFSAILASPRPEIVVSSYAIDFVDELSRAPLRVDEDDDLERVTNLITSAHEYSGGSLPASLS
ncbi:MAG: FtsK/SpoIIIE domain-containing protein, partial [Acidimicrobiia bacterium]|nr:FtsK/SpoIIIE domain-containing protein [Acidimicrobiia bacterium]